MWSGINGITLVDDYAHHPTEIRATIQAPGCLPWPPPLGCLAAAYVQRTQTLLGDYILGISRADCIVVTEVFAAREEPLAFHPLRSFLPSR
jgi:UDP-N-acetylmuramate--alanine ligase